MKIAYIIHAYKNPKQLKRLITSLSSLETYFFIHIDKKIDIAQFEKELSGTKNIFWVKREYSNWGTIATVKAVLNGIKQALDLNLNLEYFYFLSGQDYPIKNIQTIEDFFNHNREKNFLTYSELPNKDWKNGGLHRFNRFHFIISKNRYIRRIVNTVNFFLPRRVMPYSLKPFGGDFYIGLSRKSAEYVMNFIDSHPKYIRFFKYSYIPEEMFFQTILLNNPSVAEKTESKTLTYADWSKPKGPYPAIIQSSDLDNLIKSDCLFARKFDIGVDESIFDLLDNKNKA